MARPRKSRSTHATRSKRPRALDPKLGRWYEARGQVRAAYREYWKGILVGKRDVAIIFNYVGARRSHYGDRLDHRRGEITYIGEGKKGDQVLNARNMALLNARRAMTPVHVYLDCGDVFSPKKLLYAGRWMVAGHQYSYSRSARRKLHRFRLRPVHHEITRFLRFTFGATGNNPAFERDLRRFARAREELYQKHYDVVRSRDNITGEIGEYFAIKEFNRTAGTRHLVRLAGANKDIDAIQVGNGYRYAVKTIGRVPSTTSNIWAKDVRVAVDRFLICLLDPDALVPRAVFSISSKAAHTFRKRDKRQKSLKLNVTSAFVRQSRSHFGSVRI